MSSIKKQVLVNGQSHYVEVSSSLELEEVEITGTDPVSGKTVHVSLSSLLKAKPDPMFTPSPMSFPSARSEPSPGMFDSILEEQSRGLQASLNQNQSPLFASAQAQSPPSPSSSSTPSAPLMMGMDMFSDPAAQFPSEAAPLQPTSLLQSEETKVSPPLSGGLFGVSTPEGARQKSEKEEVDETIKGLYRRR